MGEGLRELPRLQDSPQEVMDRLMAPLYKAEAQGLRPVSSKHIPTKWPQTCQQDSLSAINENMQKNKINAKQNSKLTCQKISHTETKAAVGGAGRHHLSERHAKSKDAADEAAEMLGLPTDGAQPWNILYQRLQSAPWWPAANHVTAKLQ